MGKSEKSFKLIDMLIIPKAILSCSLFLLVMQQNGYAQTNCKDMDLDKVPGKWKWKYQGVNRSVSAQLWSICDPISKEFQRIMPQAPDGVIAHSLMTGGDAGTFYNAANGPRYYMNYFMMKDYDCVMKPGPVAQPEGATGCWIYFDVNNHKGYGVKLPGQSDVLYDRHRYLFLADAWIETDANGNNLLYTSSSIQGTNIKEGYFFSSKKQIPYHKISRRELYNCYKNFHEKRLYEKIAEFEKRLSKEQNEYNALSAAEKNQQSFRLLAIDGAKKTLGEYKAEKEKLDSWYPKAMKQTNLDSTAYAAQIASWHFEPEPLDAAPGKGFAVWIDDIDYYDKNKTAYQPQYIFLHYRRQDENLPKKNFMDKFCSEFNLDVLYKMLGLPLKKPGGVNTIASSLNDAKENTKTQQQNNKVVNFSLDNAVAGQYPTDWDGMKNIAVQTYEGSKWLAMTKDGYWHPRQYNKEIKDGFNLGFDVSWNPDISYYSGSFTVTLGDVEYDNAVERYREDDFTIFSSMYNSYGANFNRVILWFDPYWNNGGQLTVYSYYAGGALAVNKQIVLPDFYRDKNKHTLQIQRKGKNLLVTDNGKIIADIAAVFLDGARYNLYTFSRYKGNNSDNKNDVFYLNNIKVNY